LAANIPTINLSAKKKIKQDKIDLNELLVNAKTVFKIGEKPPTWCRDIDYELVSDG